MARTSAMFQAGLATSRGRNHFSWRHPVTGFSAVSPQTASARAPAGKVRPERRFIMAKPGKRPTIARIWRGRTTAARADEYARYLYEVGITPLVEKALGVQQLREDR